MDKLASAASTFTLQRFLTMPRSAAGSSEGRTAGSEVGARLLLASTIEVYGDSVEYLQHERNRGSVNTIGFRSCYDEGKHIAETLCFDCWQVHGNETRVMRIFNTYGPSSCPTMSK